MHAKKKIPIQQWQNWKTQERSLPLMYLNCYSIPLTHLRRRQRWIITSSCLNVSSKFERSSHRSWNCPFTPENSDSMICSQSLTSPSPTPSSSKRCFSLSVDTDNSLVRSGVLSLCGLWENKLLVEIKACIQATLSFFELVRRWSVFVAVNM